MTPRRSTGRIFEPGERRTFNDQILRDASVGRHHELSAADAVERLIASAPPRSPDQEKVAGESTQREYRP